MRRVGERPRTSDGELALETDDLESGTSASPSPCCFAGIATSSRSDHLPAQRCSANPRRQLGARCCSNPQRIARCCNGRVACIRRRAGRTADSLGQTDPRTRRERPGFSPVRGSGACSTSPNFNGPRRTKRSPDGSNRNERLATHSAVSPRAGRRLRTPDDAQVEPREVDVGRRDIAFVEHLLLVRHALRSLAAPRDTAGSPGRCASRIAPGGRQPARGCFSVA